MTSTFKTSLLYSAYNGYYLVVDTGDRFHFTNNIELATHFASEEELVETNKLCGQNDKLGPLISIEFELARVREILEG